MQTAAATDEPAKTQTSAEPRQGPGRRLVRAAWVFVGVPFVSVVVLLTLMQRRMIYHPHHVPALPVAASGFGPDAARGVTLVSTDGVTLHGWHLSADLVQSNARQRDREPTDTSEPLLVMYFPGNASNRAGRVNDLRDFTGLGCDVLIFDYRGYAENAGSPTQAGITADACAIWSFAVDELGYAPNRIILFGESLGGAVAIGLTASVCREGSPPAALITNATFDSMSGLAATHYPLLPLRWFVWDRWPSVDLVGQITCPLLMFHGTADSLIPIEHGRRLFAAAPPTSASGMRKVMVEIDGAGHNDIPVSLLREQVRDLIFDAVATSTADAS